MNAQKLILTVLTPVAAAGAAWLAGAVAKYGIHLDATGQTALATAGAAAGAAAMVKLLHEAGKIHLVKVAQQTGSPVPVPPRAPAPAPVSPPPAASAPAAPAPVQLTTPADVAAQTVTSAPVQPIGNAPRAT